MKFHSKVKHITSIKDLGDVLKESVEKAMDNSVAYMADQAQKNAPVTRNGVDIGEKVKVSKEKDGSGVRYSIKVDHSSALRYNEDFSIEQGLIARSSEEKILGSETGGVGYKFLDRAVYKSKNKVMNHITEHAIDSLKNKSTRTLTTKTLEDFN